MVKIMYYGEKIKKLRMDKNLRQEDISSILKIARGTYSQYESEYIIIPINHLNTLCNYFNVSLDYIFDFANNKKYQNNIDEINRIKSGTRLKELRKENKLTQVKLAELLNTVHQVITNYENGKNLIATPFLYTICKKYHISADYLLGKIDNPKYI